jgi:hypothetical protein
MDGILDGSNPEADRKLMDAIRSANPDQVLAVDTMSAVAENIGMYASVLWLLKNDHIDAAVALRDAIRKGEVNG